MQEPGQLQRQELRIGGWTAVSNGVQRMRCLLTAIEPLVHVESWVGWSISRLVSKPSPTARRFPAGSIAQDGAEPGRPVSVGTPRGAPLSQHHADGQDIHAQVRRVFQ